MLIAALLVIFQAMIYACIYSCGINVFASEFGYQLPEINFELFLLLEVIRQLLISGKTKETKNSVEACSDEFFKQFFSYIITKSFWMFICVIFYLCYGK